MTLGNSLHFCVLSGPGMFLAGHKTTPGIIAKTRRCIFLSLLVRKYLYEIGTRKHWVSCVTHPTYLYMQENIEENQPFLKLSALSVQTLSTLDVHQASSGEYIADPVSSQFDLFRTSNMTHFTHGLYTLRSIYIVFYPIRKKVSPKTFELG